MRARERECETRSEGCSENMIIIVNEHTEEVIKNREECERKIDNPELVKLSPSPPFAEFNETSIAKLNNGST